MSRVSVPLTELVELSPPERISHGPLYYRIIGEETTLGYLKELLNNPEETVKRGGKGYYVEAKKNLEKIIGVMSKDSTGDEHPLKAEWEIRVTLRNYYDHKIKQSIEGPEVRRKFQTYNLILENLYKGMKLSEQEEKDKQDLIKILDFFVNLEHRYQEHQFYNDDDDE